MSLLSYQRPLKVAEFITELVFKWNLNGGKAETFVLVEALHETWVQ